ncbi:MAG: hypothetical protein ACFCD0_26275 [Gemmataceae bacterium]
MSRLVVCGLIVSVSMILGGCGSSKTPDPTSAPKINNLDWNGAKVTYPDTLELTQPNNNTLVFKGKGKVEFYNPTKKEVVIVYSDKGKWIRESIVARMPPVKVPGPPQMIPGILSLEVDDKQKSVTIKTQ